MTGCSGAKVCTSARLAPPDAAGPAGHLGQQLEGALGRPHVAEGKAEIAVDHADQGQEREIVALGDKLRADDDVDLALARSTSSSSGAAAPRRRCRST